MSGICGVFYRDGKPVEREALEKMLVAMSRLGPDGRSGWREGPVGLGHLLLYNTPESLHEVHPLTSRDGNLTLVSTTRLDNREELLAAFGIPRADWPLTTDPSLCLKAYEAWGEEASSHLLGEWAFAVWDRRRRKLFLTRDQHGSTGLFYYSSERCFAFASSVKGLLALADIPGGLDRFNFARSLVLKQPGEETIWEGIQTLAGSNQLSVTAAGVRKRRYYLLENAPEVRLPSEGDYIEAFRELWEESVRCRLRHLRPACVSLSGGLDSAAVAAVAAGLLKGERLRTFTAVPCFPTEGLLPPGRHGDEMPWVRQIVAGVGNLDASYIRGEGQSPLAACLRGTQLIDEPFPIANLLWIFALREQAEREGLGVVLTGYGGNATISWYGHAGVLDGVPWYRPWCVLGDLQRWRQERGLSLLTAARSRILRPLIPREWLHRVGRWKSRPGLSLEATPLNPNLVLELDLKGRLESELGRPSWMSNPDSRAGRCDVLRPGAYSAPARALIDAEFGLETRDPALDQRILEFCLGIPDRLYTHRGQTRMLIRRAMQGRLPESVLANPTRELQSADIGDRLRRTLPELRQSWERSAADPLCRHFLDIPKMGRVLEQLESDAPLDLTMNGKSKSILLRGLVAGEFLLSAAERGFSVS